MAELTKAKIFLADERGLNQERKFRSYHTFNTGDYFNQYKTPFFSLYAFNDETLAGGHSVNVSVEENSYVILLPVVGAIRYEDSEGNEMIINSGELQIINLRGDESFVLSNPYENELVNFLQARIKSGNEPTASMPFLFNFNLDTNRSRLMESENILYPRCSIGQFRGREEAVYDMKNDGHGIFVFVIEGAFEVQGRLLHPRDGLALWNVDEPIELEALSNEAIVFMLEVRASE